MRAGGRSWAGAAKGSGQNREPGEGVWGKHSQCNVSGRVWPGLALSRMSSTLAELSLKKGLAEGWGQMVQVQSRGVADGSLPLRDKCPCKAASQPNPLGTASVGGPAGGA